MKALEDREWRGWRWYDWDWVHGVYQFWIGEEHYIGSSWNVGHRLERHRQEGRLYDRARLLWNGDVISERNLRNAEAYYIRLLEPTINKRVPPFKQGWNT